MAWPRGRWGRRGSLIGRVAANACAAAPLPLISRPRISFGQLPSSFFTVTRNLAWPGAAARLSVAVATSNVSWASGKKSAPLAWFGMLHSSRAVRVFPAAGFSQVRPGVQRGAVAAVVCLGRVQAGGRPWKVAWHRRSPAWRRRSIAGQAELLTFQPGNLGLEFERAGLQIRCQRERHEQHDLIVVDVGGQSLPASISPGTGHWISRGDAGGELPFDLRRAAGIAAIAPVGMPAGVHLQSHPGQHGVAGLGARGR